EVNNPRAPRLLPLGGKKINDKYCILPGPLNREPTPDSNNFVKNRIVQPMRVHKYLPDFVRREPWSNMVREQGKDRRCALCLAFRTIVGHSVKNLHARPRREDRVVGPRETAGAITRAASQEEPCAQSGADEQNGGNWVCRCRESSHFPGPAPRSLL